jgi:magnesium-transporting ATPase (P-type)
MSVLVAQGNVGSLERLGEYQSQFEENSSGYLQLECRSQVAGDVIGWLSDKLVAAGVPNGSVKVSGSTVTIHFQTKIAPLVIIAAAIAACLVIIALIVAWKLYKLSPAAVVGSSILLIVLIVALGLLAVVFIVKFGGRVDAGTGGVSASGGR